jgi:hypothetical protein
VLLSVVMVEAAILEVMPAATAGLILATVMSVTEAVWTPAAAIAFARATALSRPELPASGDPGRARGWQTVARAASATR